MSGTRLPCSSRRNWGVAATSAARRAVVRLEYVAGAFDEVWANAAPVAPRTSATATLAVFNFDTPNPTTSPPNLLESTLNRDRTQKRGARPGPNRRQS